MSAAIEAELAAGLRHHQNGDLRAAAAACCRILAREPRHGRALHLLGLVSFQGGNKPRAIELVSGAVAALPGAAMPRLHLGLMLADAGRLEEARQAYREAIRLEPAWGEAHFELGIVLCRAKRYAEAIEAFCAARSLKPGAPEIHNNLANALLRLERLGEAETAARRALELNPAYSDAHLTLGNVLVRRGARAGARAEFERAIQLNVRSARAWCNLGNLLREDGLLKEARECLQRALEIDPRLMESLLNLGAVLEMENRIGEAEALYRQALQRAPAEPGVWTNLGNLEKLNNRYEQALECFGRALKIDPNFPEAHNNRGATLERMGRRPEALAEYETAIRLKNTLAEAHSNRGMLLLQSGRFEEGWKEYESRLSQPLRSGRGLTGPMWDGAPLEGRTILLYAEQGLGDAIQFIRYAPLVKARGGRVVVKCPERLAPLFELVEGVDAAVSTEIPPYQVKAPLMSLPRIFSTTLESIPASMPYLGVPAERRRGLERGAFKNMGLCWAGNPERKHDACRSIPIAAFRPLLELPGIRWHSLQRGPAAAERPAALRDLEDQPESTILDTAAAILELDLVITVDTMIAHLAGALARPVWILLEYTSDWRWLLEREDSPWYPTARLFRQGVAGDWPAVVERVGRELAHG